MSWGATDWYNFFCILYALFLFVVVMIFGLFIFNFMVTSTLMMMKVWDDITEDFMMRLIKRFGK